MDDRDAGYNSEFSLKDWIDTYLKIYDSASFMWSLYGTVCIGIFATLVALKILDQSQSVGAVVIYIIFSIIHLCILYKKYVMLKIISKEIKLISQKSIFESKEMKAFLSNDFSVPSRYLVIFVHIFIDIAIIFAIIYHSPYRV